MNSRPLHERIRSDIERQILSGETGPGDRIPSEQDLMLRYGCSRMTVNKALSALNAAGLVQRRKRAGTIVAQRQTESLVLDVPDLPVEIARRGQAYRYHLLSRQVRPPLPGNDTERRLARKGSLLIVTGTHLADAKPFAYEKRLISLSAVPEIAMEDFSYEPPGSWLLRHVPWTEAEHKIGASAAASDWAGLLKIDAGAPCLTVERRTWRGADSITIVTQYFVADSYQLVARFGARAADI
jgi:GntR family transcriptional regulator, histidine utilization repressor